MKPQIIKLFLVIICVMIAGVFSLSCSDKNHSVQPSVFPPVEFVESNLLGTWQTDGEIYSNEVIILSSNYKFHQTFDQSDNNFHAETEGSWELHTAENGCVYVYLYGMKYFYQDKVIANSGNRWQDGDLVKYWDECSEDSIEMPNMVILSIGQHPSYPKNMVLRHMATQRDIVDIVFALLDVAK